MRVIFGFIFSLLFSLTGWANGAASTLPVIIKQALESENVPLDSVSIYVKRADAPQSALALNADTPRNPASVMKLLTSYAALDLLGPTYRWKTQFLARTIPNQGKLTGGLWVKGVEIGRAHV